MLDEPIQPAIRLLDSLAGARRQRPQEDDASLVWLDPRALRRSDLPICDATCWCGESLRVHGRAGVYGPPDTETFGPGVRCDFCMTIYPILWLLRESYP
jgi:hypothetical protein